MGGSPTKIDYRKKGTLILTSLLRLSLKTCVFIVVFFQGHVRAWRWVKSTLASGVSRDAHGPSNPDDQNPFEHEVIISLFLGVIKFCSCAVSKGVTLKMVLGRPV